MNKKTINIILYGLAAGFLMWHLLPLLSIGKAIAPKEKTNDEIAAHATCYGGDLDIPTFGDPLKDPVITTLNSKQRLLMQAKNLSRIDLDPYPQTTTLPTSNSWQASSYGRNNATFTIENNSVLKTVISDYGDGDAKWQTQKISVKPGEGLQFSGEYQSDTTTMTSATYYKADGSERYITLSQLPISQDWRSHSTDIVVPDDVVAVRFSVILDKVGWLNTQKYAINRYKTPGFKRGIVSFTFDDGWRSIHDQGLELFAKYDIHTTQFVVASYDANRDYMNPKQIRDMQAHGHNIGSHSLEHADLTKLDNGNLQHDIAGSHAILNTKFSGVNNIATPFGRYNEPVINAIKQCYQSHRTTNTGFNVPGYDRYAVRVQNVGVDTTAEEIKKWAEFARDNNLWIVLVYHQVEEGGVYSVDTQNLEKHLRAVKETGVHTATYTDALIETYPQGR